MDELWNTITPESPPNKKVTTSKQTLAINVICCLFKFFIYAFNNLVRPAKRFDHSYNLLYPEILLLALVQQAGGHRGTINARHMLKMLVTYPYRNHSKKNRRMKQELN